MTVKKLIEVALPLEKINEESAREKSIRHGHPSTLHLWWARRPLAAARAVIWSSLVDDPSSHPEEFPTEEDQNRERERLFKILEDLVVWENSNNEKVLNDAKAEILKSTNGNPPELLDPFAGGGSIPLEAQRLGLKAHAHDLNPVAVTINKAMIEIPPLFANMPPVNPQSRSVVAINWKGAQGLAEDVRYYGNWLKEEAFKRVGKLYPKAKNPGGGDINVIAWIWARTIKCPNPACGCNMPLASSFILSKKRGHEAWVKPDQEGNRVRFRVQYGKCPQEFESYKVGRSAIFKCPCCGEITSDEYVKNEGKEHRLGSQLMAIVAEGEHGRIYLSPDEEHILASEVSLPENYPMGELPNNPRWFSPPAFGLTEFSDLFTHRQLVMLSTFSELITEVQKRIESDAVAQLPSDDVNLDEGGSGALAYSQAICVYLALALDKLADNHSALCSWHLSGEKMQHTFGRQALPMIWDYAECNPFCNSSGCFDNTLKWIIKCIENFPATVRGSVLQQEAQSDLNLTDIMVSTDPPYYDNIGYADLSDFFYLWLRQNLKSVFPSLFRTLLVPKTDELIATPYRHEGNLERAKSFFEQGMFAVCCQLYNSSRIDIPVSIFYAYKSGTDLLSKCRGLSGWETMLSAIIKAGFTISGTWPLRTEMISRSVALNTNALSTSIVLVCRKRTQNAPICSKRDFVSELRRELRSSVARLQASNIAPVDLAQASIGPGMAVFSKYSQVLEADGTETTVREALRAINQELDLYLNEQGGDLDGETRFCVDLYTQSCFNEMKYGDANTLATAKNVSVESMRTHGTLYAQKGIVRLRERSELPANINPQERNIWLLCQQLVYRMEKEGVEGCAKGLAESYGGAPDRAKELAYRLYMIAGKKGWSQEAYAYNRLVVSWSEIQTRAAVLKQEKPTQRTFFDDLEKINE